MVGDADYRAGFGTVSASIIIGCAQSPSLKQVSSAILETLRVFSLMVAFLFLLAIGGAISTSHT